MRSIRKMRNWTGTCRCFICCGREARLKVASVYPKFSQPRWTGAENVKGKTILICADEGLGDTIQFVRYVPMLTARGARHPAR